MLKRVSIQNFKSLKDVTLDLQKVNLLIGPNNSGKTNFLRALEFFSIADSQTQNVEAIKSFSYKHQIFNVKYAFVYEYKKGTYTDINYNLPKDKFFNYSQESEISIIDNLGSVEVKNEYFFTDEYEKRTDTDVMGGHIKEFLNFIRTKIFRPDPSKLLHQAKLSGNHVELAPDGSNLISFYFSIFNNHEEISNRLQSDLARCIPEISYFRTPAVEGDSMLGLKFFDKQKVGYWASEVSEGVLYFLILLCIVNQPTPPRLLLIEEPERGIHPRRIWEVMKLILQLADEKDIQIILTTHNEHVVNAFSTMPESVFVFDKDEETGATTVQNLQKDIIKPSHKKSEELELDKIDFTSDLGQTWMYGLIGGVPADQL